MMPDRSGRKSQLLDVTGCTGSAPTSRRLTPCLLRMLRTAEKERSVSSAISRSERPAAYCSTTKASTRCWTGELGQRLELSARGIGYARCLDTLVEVPEHRRGHAVRNCPERVRCSQLRRPDC